MNTVSATRRTIHELAALGGSMLFSTVKPIGQLSVPDPQQFFALLDEVRSNGVYSGNGPMVELLEQRLCELHDTRYCVAYGNASIAIVGLTQILSGGRKGEIILPAFTYTGLPHLVRWAGQMPRFADVDPSIHALSAATVQAVIGPQTTGILAVHQVNAPADIDGLTALADAQGIPLFFDSVHALYNTWRGRPIGGHGRAEVFSLHATKMLNGFEGGYVTTNDPEMDQQLRNMRNGGRAINGNVESFGISGNLSEFHAAFVLAGIEDLPAACGRNKDRYERYIAGLKNVPGLTVFPYPQGPERLNYEFTLVEVADDLPLSRDDLLEILLAENTRTRAYYSPPVHLSPHRPSQMAAPSLPVTEGLAKRYLQMPMGELVSLEDIDQICDLLRLVLLHADEVAHQLYLRRGSKS